MTHRPDLARRVTRAVVGATVGALLLAGCGAGRNLVDRPAEPPSPAPLGTAGEAPVTTFVRGVERRGDRFFVDLTIINGADRAVKVADERQPIRLRTSGGANLESTDKETTVPAFSRDDLRVEFSGDLGNAETAQLEFNAAFSLLNDPVVRITDIPIPASGVRVFFRDDTQRTVDLEDAVGYNANGSSLVLRALSIDAEGVEVSYLFVNGLDRPVQLSSRTDPVELIDNTGRRLVATPPDAGPKVEVPAKGRATGVFRFPGALSPTATSANLTINGQFGDNRESTSTPEIAVADLPLPRGN